MCREASTPKLQSKMKTGIASVFSLFRTSASRLRDERRRSDTVDPATPGHTVTFADQPGARHSFGSVDPPVSYIVQETQECRSSFPVSFTFFTFKHLYDVHV